MPNLGNWFNVKTAYIPPLDTTEVNVARGEVLKRLTDTCAVQTESVVSNAKVWSTVASYPCRLDPMGEDRAASLGVDAHAATYELFLPYAAAVPMVCRIIHNGNTYEVWKIVDDASNMLLKSVVLTRIS